MLFSLTAYSGTNDSVRNNYVALYCSNFITLYYIVVYYIIFLYYSILYYAILHYVISYFAMGYLMILDFVILYYSDCIMLY